jgi:hypothetical protein
MRRSHTSIDLKLIADGSGLSVTENYNVTEFSNNRISAIQAALVKRWWAEPDSDRRPLARKANVLTRLDDRPTRVFDKRTTLVNIRILFLKQLLT